MLNRIGSYRVVDQLGEGAFGAVYRAYQPFLDRHVAIKTLHTHVSADSATQSLLMQEARTIGRLRHRNVITVHDFGTVPDDDGRVLAYLVMEYLPGGALDARLREANAPMPPADALLLVEGLAQGLDYAHAQNVVHRDLKPANILFTAAGEPVIADFGLSKLVEIGSAGQAPPSNPHQTTLSGTPAYMAPEQVLGKPTSAASDQYALATLAYQLLTGRLPFEQDENMLDFLLRRAAELPPPPGQFVPTLPPDVDAVLLRGLVIEPGERYPSAGEFAGALADALFPNRHRQQVITVSDPLQAAALRATRGVVARFLWGIAAVMALMILFVGALYLRGYRDAAPLFLWDGIIAGETRTADGWRTVLGIWPGSAAEHADYRVGDLIQDDLFLDAATSAHFQVNGVMRAALPPMWQPNLGDVIAREVRRGDASLALTYRLERSTYPLLPLLVNGVPALLALGAAVALLRRWGEQPTMPLMLTFYLVVALVLVAAAAAELVVGVFSLALYVLLALMLHMVLLLPEPARWLETHPRRVWLLYAAVPLGLVEFMLGISLLRVGSFDLSLLVALVYGVPLVGLVLRRWVREQRKRYPALDWLTGALLFAVLSVGVPLVLLTMDAVTAAALFGNPLAQYVLGYCSIAVLGCVPIVGIAIGYHRLQRQIGPVLITGGVRTEQGTPLP